MSYEDVIKIYENNTDNYRILMMKLSINNSFEILVNKLKNVPSTEPVSDLFSKMKGEWVIKCGKGNRVYDDKIYNNLQCKNVAVLFTIRVLSKDFTLEDRKHLYNVYNYIQTHPYIFGNKIRFHVRNTIEKLLTKKQQIKEKNFKLNFVDYCESDTESCESETEKCEYCENSCYLCECN